MQIPGKSGMAAEVCAAAIVGTIPAGEGDFSVGLLVALLQSASGVRARAQRLAGALVLRVSGNSSSSVALF
jgi:hypothetical protein